jgi:hypothetical protein
MRPRFLFRNEALQLLAFSLHESGSNLPEVNPLRPWRPVDDADHLDVIDADHLDVIYEWGPDKFGALSRELERAGCFVFGARRTGGLSRER